MDPDAPKARGSIFDRPAAATALVHYYRATMARSNTWRSIVDNTINWAVAVTAAMISFGISGGGDRHIVLLVAHFFILMFLLIEARRYSYYTSIDWRVRLVEREFFAKLLEGNPDAGTGEWRDVLAADIRRPHRPLTIWAAFGLRLRRTYFWIFLILTLAWAVRVATYPSTARSLDRLLSQSDFAFIPGWALWAVLAALYVVLLAGLRSGSRTRQKLEEEGFTMA